MQILPKTNPSETKVTNTGVSKPPQIGGCTVSRSSGLENNFFLLPKPFSENSRTADSKNVRFLSFGPFSVEKMAVEVEKARFRCFVLPSDFFKVRGGSCLYLHCNGRIHFIFKRRKPTEVSRQLQILKRGPLAPAKEAFQCGPC